MGDVTGLVAQGAALGGEFDDHHALIFTAAGATEQAFGLQAFEQRRERARIGQQACADFAYGQTVLFPQHQHRQVLRIGQAQRLQQRLVDLGHHQRSGVKGEAGLIVQQQVVAGIRGVALGGHVKALISDLQNLAGESLMRQTILD